jgi:hypothetical protein
MSTVIPCRDVQPGDLVEWGGEVHFVARVQRAAGWAWPIAFDDRGWAIALGEYVTVTRP